MDNDTNQKYASLRPADLIAKVAQVNLRGVVRALAALELVADHLGVPPASLLGDNSIDYPSDRHAIDCDIAFDDLRQSTRSRDIFKIRDMK